MKRDGRRVPFEPHKISQALYAVTEELEQPNAFLASELAEGVLHFLPNETDPSRLTTAQVAELIVKVVRELGHPRIAQAFQARQERQASSTHKSGRAAVAVSVSPDESLPQIVQNCVRAFSLQAVYARDVAAAHEEGLLTLGGLDHPERLTAVVVDNAERQFRAGNWQLWNATPGQTLVFDSPEYALAQTEAAAWWKSLAAWLETTRRAALVHLNCARPPDWTLPTAQGPLFAADDSRAADAREQVRQTLLHCAHPQPLSLGARGAICPTIAWHVRAPSAAGVAKPEGVGRIVMDRANKPITLGSGLDRQRPAVLAEVELDLTRFLARPEIAGDGERFLDKLPTLVRMAVRAGVQKRNFLRRRSDAVPALGRTFLVDRARLLLVPRGLAMVETALQAGSGPSRVPLEFARRVADAIESAAQHESKTTSMEVVVGESTWSLESN
ncbi:MAG: hypothetical protein L0Y72_21905 [Gemmataceae bacterium]|nr:hypothetical protein [Gemmataceae bacterium]